MALSTGGSAASRGTSLGAEVRQAPPVMDDYRGVVYNALVAQGPIERRRRARTQPGLDRSRRRPRSESALDKDKDGDVDILDLLDCVARTPVGRVLRLNHVHSYLNAPRHNPFDDLVRRLDRIDSKVSAAPLIAIGRCGRCVSSAARVRPPRLRVVSACQLTHG
ncbi:unnamed protein product [Pelagomonas calceolata]|uniref:Uncharacterized protein n=1 Tax=Pelagomonas calceolata TaxID=35677 RepID=A0A8J2X0W6_9STRA|nr:unnamed protein product [Pelagomonas calceolata]